MTEPTVKNPFVGALVFDEENEKELYAHGLSPARVEQILDGPHAIVRNRRNRRGLIMIIGRDHGGASIAVPAEPTYDKNTWRPITGWSPCKPAELAVLRRIK